MKDAEYYWKERATGIAYEARLAKMRDEGHIFGVAGIGYNVLHVRPFVSFSEVLA